MSHSLASGPKRDLSETAARDAVARGGPQPGSGGRHRGREVALQVLYAVDLARTGPRAARLARAEADVEPGAAGEAPDDRFAVTGREAFDLVSEHFVVAASASDFARALVVGVTESVEALDETLSRHARNWRVSRMAAVDRNVLRLAIYELCETPTPVAVVIDEAVDLARRFGSDSSPAFVNGILDAVAREVRAA